MNRYEIPLKNMPKKRPQVTRNGTFMPAEYQKWKKTWRSLLFTFLPKKELANQVLVAIGCAEKSLPGDVDNLVGAIMDASAETKLSRKDGILFDSDRCVVGVLHIRNDSKSDGWQALEAIKRVIAQMTPDDFRRADETVFYVERVAPAASPLFKEAK